MEPSGHDRLPSRHSPCIAISCDIVSSYSVVLCFLFIVYFAALLGSREYSEEGRVINEWLNWKNLERSVHSLICALSLRLSGGTEEECECPQSG